MIVYLYRNKLNGMGYVGETKQGFKERHRKHIKPSSKTPPPIDIAIQKYGIENFEYYIIDTAKTLDELYEKERYWIKELGTLTPNGYNQCYGGKTTEGYRHREQSKLKMSQSRKGTFLGKNNPYYGKKHTKEIREKMSKAWTEERRALISKYHAEGRYDNSHYTKKVRNITENKTFNSVKEASEYYNIFATHITACCRGRRKSTHGCKWEYVD